MLKNPVHKLQHLRLCKRLSERRERPVWEKRPLLLEESAPVPVLSGEPLHTLAVFDTAAWVTRAAAVGVTPTCISGNGVCGDVASGIPGEGTGAITLPLSNPYRLAILYP